MVEQSEEPGNETPAGYDERLPGANARRLRVNPQVAPAALAASSNPAHTAGTRLRGGWLLLARTTWLVVAGLAVGLFVAGIPAEFAQLQVACPTAICVSGQLPPASLRALEDLGLSRPAFAAYSIAMDVLFAAVCGL